MSRNIVKKALSGAELLLHYLETLFVTLWHHGCSNIGSLQNKELIALFSYFYNINYHQSERCKNATSHLECAKKFKDLNAFFTRDKRRELISMYATQKSDFVSPCDAHTLLFYSFDASKMWIKGNQFSLSKLTGINISRPDDYFILISRLSPREYHRVHAPCNAKVEHIHRLPQSGTRLVKSIHPVKPQVVNKRYANPYTENDRVILTLKSKFYGRIYMIIIGATCVNNVVLSDKVKKNGMIQKNDDIATFKIGGSTVLTLIPHQKVNLHNLHMHHHLDWKSLQLEKKILKEKLIDVGERIFSKEKQ